MATKPPMPSTARLRSTGGFTLIEFLVVLAIFAVVTSYALPSVVIQTKKAEISYTVKTLQAIEGAIGDFYTKTHRWPYEVNQLVHKPGRLDPITNTMGGLNGARDSIYLPSNNRSTIPPGLLQKWDGPYLEVGAIPEPGLQSPPNGPGFIVRRFAQICINRTEYLAIKVDSISQADAELISLNKEDEKVLTFGQMGSGRVQWIAPDTLVYLAATVSPPKCNY